MPYRLCTRGRSAAHTALLFTLTLSVLLSALLPVGAAQASDGATTAATTSATATDSTASSAPAATAAEDCAILPLAPFGDPGSAVGKATVPADGSACFTFTAEQPGLHRVLTERTATAAQVFDGETQLDCYDVTWGSGWCTLPRAGAFTLKLVNTSWGTEPLETHVTVTPLASTTGCAQETGTSWDLPPVNGSAVSPFGLVCHPFTGKPGERITVDFHTDSYGESVNWITDETGAHICPHFNEDDSDGCVLPGDGPYRVLGHVRQAERGFPAPYTLKIRRLSDPAGCARVPVNAYNSAPTTVDPATGCKIFTASAAGRYSVYEVTDGARSALTVYDREGKTVCAGCGVPAGDYTVLTDHATLILDRAGTAGCEPVELGTYQGTFATAGEIDCLTLPLPEGARMAALTPLSGPAPQPEVVVVDADGVQRCNWETLGAGTCALTGSAPFRALVSTDDSNTATGSYRIALHRTDAASGCPAVPAGDFTAGSAAARFSTGDGVFSHCLSIPADDHSAMENLQLRAVSGTSTAEFSVLDADGKQVCDVWASLSTWTTCALAPGVAHTVLVTGRDTAAEYTLARRDVTATAKGCAANPATAVDGPSTGGTPAAPGLLLCRQVTTADTGDTLHLNVRDPLGTANILAYDAEGDAVCSYRNTACAVTGSTRYQVLVTVPTNLKAAESYRFDALRIATSTGPAAECAKAPNVNYGYGPVTGTLDEQHTAVCAALPTAYDDRFDFVVSDTAGGTQTAVPALYDASLDNTCTLYIPTGYKCSVKEPYTTDVTPSILVIGLPEKASQTAYKAELVCTSSLCGTEQITVGTVTPTSGVSGTKPTVTVTGSALHEDDKVRISQSGKTVESTTTSVAADRKSLTAVLDLTGLAPGDWSLSVITHNGWEHPRGTFTVTPAPLENTAAPTVTGIARVGSKLTAKPGSWTPTPDSYTYQWKADGKAISGATASTYLVPASLRGKKLTVAVTARKSGRQSTTAESSARVIAAAPRDHAGAGSVPDGVGDLLTLNSSGSLTFQHGSGTGAFSGKTSGSGWSTSVKAVPFGDVNGDRCNDVLVRMADGSLRAYRPGCGKAVTPSTPYVSLGTGWNQYNVLTSPGDITGDGRADLITRNSSTGTVYLHKGTSDGKLAARVKLYDNWKGYKKIMGVDDLNGDGHGDLLAQDSSNELWRYNGTGTGKFTARVKVFDNWGAAYNVVVGVGDITRDGKADLVSRDTSGNLWRNSGNGRGSFSGRVKIATGWQGYKALF
ncbi:FG-GAP-like repeat-containing protein [Streptomyces sp. NPDC059862]|uniref:FG-GAP-like repeat-containing protein n=1 Tax=Streptomyces sp. NPDC059862 TaxID=3346975 RepID=UPI00364D6EFB